MRMDMDKQAVTELLGRPSIIKQGPEKTMFGQTMVNSAERWYYGRYYYFDTAFGPPDHGFLVYWDDDGKIMMLVCFKPVMSIRVREDLVHMQD